MLDRLSDDVLRRVMMMFVGDEEVDRFVGTLGGVNKRFLRLSRDRHIWERFYYLLFPRAKFNPDNDIVHQGPCTFNRCGVGFRGYYGSALHGIPYELTRRGFIKQRLDSWRGVASYYITNARCENPDHYPPEAFVFRRHKSRFKDLFKRSAMRYYTMHKAEHAVDLSRDIFYAKENARLANTKLNELLKRKAENEWFNSSFIDEYKTSKKKKNNHFICDYACFKPRKPSC